jgi:hypothetical protein
LTLQEIARELAQRLVRLFLRDECGNRPFNGKNEFVERNPHWCDYLLFHEFFHGDTGRGLGASHQTGWTGLVAMLLHETDMYTQGQQDQLGRAITSRLQALNTTRRLPERG